MRQPHVGLAELFAIRDAQSPEELVRRMKSVARNHGISLKDQDAWQRGDLARAAEYTREALQRLGQTTLT